MDGSWPVHAPKTTLVRRLRDYLHQVCHSLGLSTRIVPHQLRHTYATEMLRAGVSFPALMKLLGHTSPEMTMQYLDVALTDLQREFQLARSKPRHLVPQPKAPFAPLRAGLDGVIDSLLAAQHVLEMFRRALPNGTSRRRLDRLSNRLTKIVIEARKLAHALRMGRDWPVKSRNRKLRTELPLAFQCPVTPSYHPRRRVTPNSWLFLPMREFATKFHRQVDEQGQKYQGLSTGAKEV